MYKQYDERVKHFLKTVSTINTLVPLPNTRKAITLLLEEMSTEKGFSRHDGRDYFVHPVAIAQTAIDFGMVHQLINEDEKEEADRLLTVCLLHDILEDVKWVSSDYLIEEFDYRTYVLIDNVSKREGEPIKDYFVRVKSDSISALVKTLDRLNNISTLSSSTPLHRAKQYKETKEFYLPLFKHFRRVYIHNAQFYWQARTIIISLLNEIERSLKYESPELHKTYCE